jgi:outer membrane protein assembly factor BamB
LFLLDKLGPAAGGSPAVALMLFNRRAAVPFVPAGSRSLPQLVALDLKEEGKIAWAVGGRASPEEPRLEGIFFLGPPLPDQGRLYLLGESVGDVSLYVLDAASGRLLWSQLVALPPRDRDVFTDPVRRLAGATLTLADGILVCPTTSGGVVAVDPATRMLRWACQYPVVEDRFATDPPLHPWDPATEGLADTAAVVADGRVILLAPDAKQLLCLDLATGRRLWARDRGDLLYVGCADEGKVVMVAAHSVLALNLSDGAPAWRRDLPAQTVPSGRGLLAGHCYWLPAAEQLLQIDLREGRIVRQIKAAGTLGNLVVHRNRLISQSLEAVQQFGPETTPQ